MLLDKYILTKAFENLLSFHNANHPPAGTASDPNAPPPPPPPASYIKRVNQSMTKIDPLLKTLQVRPSPPEGLVQAYLNLIGDRSDANFKRILELKGVPKKDHSHLLELFSIHRDGGGVGRTLVQSSPLLTPLFASMGGGGIGVVGGGLGIVGSAAGGLVGHHQQGGSGSVMTSRFDAATSLGEKLLSAARDMSATEGGSANNGGGGSSGTTAAGAGGMEKATINENLKNIGNFFRRDIGALGARFGKRDITPTGGGHHD